MFTTETTKVKPFNQDLLLKLIEKAIPLKAGELEYHIDIMAIFADKDENLLVDTDCCYMFLDNTYIDGEIQFVYMIPVRIWRETPEGKSMRMDCADFYFPLSKKYFDVYALEVTTLKEYQGQRHNYNPRIIKNQRDFLKLINAQ